MRHSTPEPPPPPPPPPGPKPLLRPKAKAVKSPLDDVGAALLESYHFTNWAGIQPRVVAHANSPYLQCSPIPPDLYTATLRAVLVEWGNDPIASLGARLQAADSLCAILGVHRDMHDQVG